MLCRFLTRSDVAFVFHALTFIIYLRVWIWHTSSAALILPGSRGFGWFFRYLTFCSYTLQLVQLGLCVLAKVVWNMRLEQALKEMANRLSCAVFGMANTVTILYYAIESTTNGLVEGGKEDRPWWLATSVHVFNSVVAWTDLFIVEERNFCGKSRHLAMTFGLLYTAWLLVVYKVFGKFPYPVMNQIPFPWGYLSFTMVGVIANITIFELGRFTKHYLPEHLTWRRRHKVD